MTAQLRPVAWHTPDDTWRESDGVFERFLESFTAKDIPRLRTEGRVQPITRKPRTDARDALRKALDDGTIGAIRELRTHTDRDIAAAARALTYQPTNQQTRLARHLYALDDTKDAN